MTQLSQKFDGVAAKDYVPTADHRVLLSGLSWDDFESFIALRGIDAAGPRVTYLEGTLELMSPSDDHEFRKEHFGVVVEAYLNHLRVRFRSVGSWLVKRVDRKAAAEPDKCYIVNERAGKQRPDFAIEVIWTSGGIDKLHVYQRLDVPEVWMWRDGEVRFFWLEPTGYVERPTSHFVPNVDKSLLLELLELEWTSDVYAELKKRLG